MDQRDLREGKPRQKTTGPPGWGLGVGLTTLPRQTPTVTETYTAEINQQRPNLEDSLHEGRMTQTGESREEASQPTYLLTMKAKTRIATWNVRTLYQAGKVTQVAKEMDRYNLEILGISECRWNGSGLTRLATGHRIIYSGHASEDHEHTEGVGIMMTEESAKSLIEWEPVSPRIITARFNSKGRKVTIIQCYAPTNTAEEETKEEFYTMLQGILDKVPARDMKIVMGDLNAKIGSENKGKETVMGKEALGVMNENGELFSDFLCFQRSSNWR